MCNNPRHYGPKAIFSMFHRRFDPRKYYLSFFRETAFFDEERLERAVLKAG